MCQVGWDCYRVDNDGLFICQLLVVSKVGCEYCNRLLLSFIQLWLSYMLAIISKRVSNCGVNRCYCYSRLLSYKLLRLPVIIKWMLWEPIVTAFNNAFLLVGLGVFLLLRTSLFFQHLRSLLSLTLTGSCIVGLNDSRLCNITVSFASVVLRFVTCQERFYGAFLGKTLLK